MSGYTLITGANGFGKTTICAVLRSLKTGDAEHVAGRKTLGTDDPIGIEVLTQGGLSRFDGENWNAPFPSLAIFDGTFIAENVHSGDVVEIEHRRNLYRVIVGEQGVRLAEEDTRLSAESRAKTTEISTATRAIQPHLPAGMDIDQFVGLAIDPDIDQRIEQQERVVESARQAQQIAERAELSVIALPEPPGDFMALLGRTLDDVAADAEAQIEAHITAHTMAEGGGNWIAEGMPHAEETCPFCGQDLEGLPLIAAYRAVFSDRYDELRNEISLMEERIDELFGDGAVGRFNVGRERNGRAAEFWARYCEVDPAAVTHPENIAEAMMEMGQALRSMIQRKATAPLDEIAGDEEYRHALAGWETAKQSAELIGQAINAANALIVAKKDEAAGADVAAAETELALRRAVKARHSDEVANLCADYTQAKADKDAIERRKDDIRAQLNRHTEAVMQPYEDRINHYLDAFNAGFRIAGTQHGYPGGAAASSYQLVINDTPINLGDGRTPVNEPCFKNTLSAGDRTTLALAFFLANLDLDPDLANKVVVFDDPFSSQDAFRRRQTVFEISKIGDRCAQVMVLSHDATFLKQVWDKAPAGNRVALTLADQRARGSKIMALDLERACQGRTATDIDDLQAFMSNGMGNRVDIVRKMRGVLETYCWTSYPGSFQAGQDWLGEIARKIRDGGEQHPAQPLYDEIDQINDYSSQYYHGEDQANAVPDDIDPAELTGYVRRTLRIVNALQA